MKKIVQEIPIIILGGGTVQTIAHFFDINQKITNREFNKQVQNYEMFL